MIKLKFLTLITIVLLLPHNSKAALELKVNNRVINIVMNFILIIFYNFNIFEFEYAYIII